jgi:uncharacterized protein (DUF3084 family)
LESQADGNLAKQTADLESRRAELQQQMRALEIRAREIDSLAAEVRQRESTLELRQQEIDERQSTLDTQFAAAEQLQSDAKQRVDTLESELQQTQASLQIAQQQLGKQAAEFDSERAAQAEMLKDRESALADSNEQSATALAELEIQRVELETRHAELETKHAELEAENTGLETERAELDAERAEFESQRSEFGQRETELGHRAAELEQLQETLAAKEQSIEQSARSLEEQGTLLGERALEISNRHTEVLKWQGEVESMRSSVKFAEGQKMDAEAAVLALQQTIHGLEAELISLRAELDAKTAQDDALSEEALTGRLPSDPSLASETHPLHDDSSAKPKEQRLQSFATRQEALSQREAELNLREDELTSRELDRQSDVAVTATTPDETVPLDETVKAGQDDLIQPEAVPAVDQGSTEKRASSWEEVLGWSRIDQDASESSEDPSASFGERDHFSADVSPATVSMMDLRRQEYKKRFGPCSNYHQDDDASMRVDVAVYPPGRGRDFATLVTSGMSDYPIPMPNGQRDVHAELLLYATHVDDSAVQILRGAAKVPFQSKQGLSIGTTGSLRGLKGLMQGSKHNDCVYMLPIVESDSKPIAAKELIGSTIQLFWLVTITDAERKLIDTGGIHRYLSLLQKNHHAVYFDLMRECYVKRKSWFRR